MPLASGQRFGAYEIVSRVGAGGMGEVYRARDPRLDREVALKVLPAAAVADDTARARLLREARMAAKLNHPNVCTIHEVGEAEGQAYIAMELVAGQALSDRLAAGRQPMEQVIRLGQEMADALAHAHEHGVVHRDFKAANVIVTPEGRAKVLDFGLAKPLLGKELAAATTLTQASLTEAGAIVGTLAYMAPEQLRGRPADARSDVWALGVVLYEMAAGRRPFGGDTGFELSSAILNQPPRTLPAEVPPPLASMIERCLAKEPSQRYQRAGEVRSGLDALLTGSAPAAWPWWRASLVTHRWPVVAAVLSSALLIVAGLEVGGVRSRLLGRGDGRRAIRMAVLPFANLSGNPEQEYLSDGLTQEMIAQLGRLHPDTLSVIARTSVMRYKKTDTPIDRIGRELGVDYVLEGSEQREGGRVRITAELVKVRDQTQLWSETYERELSGILALQSEVARKVAESLALKLMPVEQARLASARAIDPDAYQAYLKGLHHWYNLTPGDLDSGQRYFELAIAKDPNYALGYAGLALVWAGRSQLGLVSPADAAPKAKAAAQYAMELDDTVAETHYTLAVLRAWVDWDWAGAEREFKRAIELNPSFPDALIYYSHFLMIVGRPDEAMPQARRALELDPFNPLFHILYAVDFVYVRRWDEAIAQARTALSTAPDDAVANGALWYAFGAKGMHREAFAAARVYLKGLYDDPAVDEALERGFAEAGYQEAMRRAAQPLIAHFHKSYVCPVDIASLYVAAGETSRAVDWLEKGYEVRDQSVPYSGLPVFDSLRPDPRFQALLRHMNLPVAAPAGTPRPKVVAP
jgi:TolB-like protein/Tfp pilus assembly protein PilF